MGMFDELMAQIGGHVDVANLAEKVGLSEEQVGQAIQALGLAHVAEGDTAEVAAANTGLSVDTIRTIIEHIGGEGALGRFASLLQQDGDGMDLGSIAGKLGGLFGR